MLTGDPKGYPYKNLNSTALLAASPTENHHLQEPLAPSSLPSYQSQDSSDILLLHFSANVFMFWLGLLTAFQTWFKTKSL